MVEETMWWVKGGYYPFKPGKDGYPCPGQVIRHYRKQRLVQESPMTQHSLARALALSEKSVWAMENEDAGLNSFCLRVKVVKLLDIPSILLKLDASYLSDKQTSPCPGLVIRKYRIKKKKENGGSWTQHDLAGALNLSEKSIQLMEKQDVGLDSLSRRELLITIFDIPPVLLGLDALHLFENTSVIKPTKPHLPIYITLYQEKLLQYQTSLSSFWESHYREGVSIATIEKIIHDLRNSIAYLTANQQEHIRVLLCHYHQLALDVARDQGELETALAHAHLAITLAKKSKNDELLAAALYRRGLTYFDLEDTASAAADLRDALPFARHARPQLQGMVYMETGRFQAHMAETGMEKFHANKLLDQTETLVRRGPLEDDGSYVKLDNGRYHIGRAATLITLQQPIKALDELDEADRLTRGNYTRRHAYIDILRARAYFAQGEFASATDLATDALRICLVINSESNIADIAKLYHSLRKTSYGNALSIVQLGLLLQSRK